MARRRSRMGAAFGTDHVLTARVIELAAQLQRPAGLAEIAAKYAIGEAKVAVSMRYAEEAGYVRRHRGAVNGQDAWDATPEGLRVFPPGRPHVMPDEVAFTLPSGATVGSVADPRKIGSEGELPITDAAKERVRELEAEARELPPGS